MARSVRHFLEVLDDLSNLGIEFISLRENIDTSGPLGRAMVVIVGAIAELERNLIVERVKAGMRRARLEGRQIGRTPLDIDRGQVVRDRRSGMSLTCVAKKHRISRASVCRLMKEAGCGQQVEMISSQREPHPGSSWRPSNGLPERPTSLQLGVLRFRGDEDGDVGVGVFPQREEILIRGSGFGGVALQGVSAGEAEMRERAQREV